jgi:hypothetical protein
LSRLLEAAEGSGLPSIAVPVPEGHPLLAFYPLHDTDDLGKIALRSQFPNTVPESPR